MKQAFHNADSVEVARQRFLDTGTHEDAQKWHEAGSWVDRFERHDSPSDTEQAVRQLKGITGAIGVFLGGMITGIAARQFIDMAVKGRSK